MEGFPKQTLKLSVKQLMDICFCEYLKEIPKILPYFLEKKTWEISRIMQASTWKHKSSVDWAQWLDN